MELRTSVYVQLNESFRELKRRNVNASRHSARPKQRKYFAIGTKVPNQHAGYVCHTEMW